MRSSDSMLGLVDWSASDAGTVRRDGRGWSFM